MVLIDVDGHVIASTVPELAAHDRAELREMVEQPPSRSDSPAIRIVAGRPYQLVLAPVRAPEVIAWVAMGFVINDKLAADMAQLVGVEVSFVGTATGAPVFLASSMDAARRSELIDSGTATTDRIFVVGSPHEEYFGLVQPLSTARSALQMVLHSSIVAALRPYAELRLSILVIGGSILLVAVLLAALLAQSATRPVKLLTDSARRIESGDYSFKAGSHSTREFSSLASAFNAMRNAVAEREDRILFHAHHDALTGLRTGHARHWYSMN